jgi:hypothetical protein
MSFLSSVLQNITQNTGSDWVKFLPAVYPFLLSVVVGDYNRFVTVCCHFAQNRFYLLIIKFVMDNVGIVSRLAIKGPRQKKESGLPKNSVNEVQVNKEGITGEL